MCATKANFDVSLYLYAQLLEVLYYRTVDCTTKVGVLIRDDTSFVADAIIYVLTEHVSGLWGRQTTNLKAAFAEELISRSERYLNDGGEFCHLFCCVILNVGNTL